MRLSSHAKLGLRAVNVIALLGAAACGSGGGQGASGGGTQSDSGTQVADDAGGFAGDGASGGCVTGCTTAEASTPIEVDASAEAEAGPAFNGDPTGIFVAPTGSDAAPGTMSKPVLSLHTAVALAQAAHKDVYVCSGTYPENVVVATTGVGLHGGYDCANAWIPVDDRPVIAPAAGVPLSIENVSTSMTVERLQLVAPDAVNAGDSSIAVLAASSHVAFIEVVLQAGAGAQGTGGSSPGAITSPAIAGNAGTSFTQSMCPVGDTSGYCGQIGSGGSAPTLVLGPCAAPGGAGGDGQNYGTHYNGSAPRAGFGGAAAGSAATGGVGGDGHPGGSGSAGSAAQSGVGTFSAQGYEPTNSGTSGAAGGTGAGGGGGVGGVSSTDSLGDAYCAFVYLGGGGGAGGWGGCGGTAGGGGGGGGASLGVVAFESSVTFLNCQISTSSGGNGGNPGKGADGQPGGHGGAGGTGAHGGGTPTNACGNEKTAGNAMGGGSGGRGGAGGEGGPGGGGPSIGVAVMGAPAPDVSTVDFNIGPGGSGGPGAMGANAADGLSAQVYALGAGDGGVDAASDH
jgi:hypothetical protein